MSESISYNNHHRPRARSVFEIHSETDNQIQIVLFNQLLTYQNSSHSSNETTVSIDQSQLIIREGKKRTIFFICGPLIAAFLVMPLITLFWQAGWNLLYKWLDTPIGKHWAVLLMVYFLGQLILLVIYLYQDYLYDYLYKQKIKLFISIILQFHILITSLAYIIQWVTIWTMWDRYTPDDWLSMLLVSITAVVAVIALMGHPCDLVYAPFILSYDSIEYNIRIECPFSTKNISLRFAHFINYILYEYIISFFSILAWRGPYNLLDNYLYPKRNYMSAGSSLLFGYILFFFIVYTQSYSDKICQLPTYVYLGLPTLMRNIRHSVAFFTCILVWRGFWFLFDTYNPTLKLAKNYPYLFDIICMLISFFILSLMKTASSLNGPLSYTFGLYDLFPHYPNSYLVECFNQKNKLRDISSETSNKTTNEPYTLSLLQ